MNSKHQIHIVGTLVSQNLLMDTWHLYANHCRTSIADKKFEQITQEKEWRNEAITGRLTALVEKQQKSNTWMINVPKEEKTPEDLRKYSMINWEKSLKWNNKYMDGMGSEFFRIKNKEYITLRHNLVKLLNLHVKERNIQIEKANHKKEKKKKKSGFLQTSHQN